MTGYPFTAVVGHEGLKRALLANVVDPRIGGVLIRGDRGTAKTTVVRALALLLPAIRARAGCAAACDPEEGSCPFCDRSGQSIERPARIVELPLGATEDRVAGTLDLERALQTGERRLEPGLLATAHRGVLYIDEVNLLPDHLVDLLLDVATSGVNVVERDGNSVAHPARFVLVGTMNPEEGDLRPQLLDRFGLVVEVRTPTDAAQRAEIVSRRVAFDRDPAAFAARFAAEERGLCARLSAARAALPAVVVPDAMLALAVDLCVEAGVDGLRADIALYRTAMALAALDHRDHVEERDIFEAALLALPHRQRHLPDGTHSAPPVEDIVRGRQQPDPDDRPDGGEPVVPRTGPASDPGGAAGNGRPDGDRSPSGIPTNAGPAGPRAPDHVTRPAGTQRLLLPPLQARIASGPRQGRRRRPVSAQRGHTIGHQEWDGRSGDLAALATVVTALLDGRRGTLHRTDIRMHRRKAPPRRLVLLLVDASGSMGARERMADTKAVLMGLLGQAATHRDAVALEVFRDDQALVLVPPTRQPAAVRTAIAALPTGGRTPLLQGLRSAGQLLIRERARYRVDETLLVIVTDGRYGDDLRTVGTVLRDQVAPALVVDTEDGPVRLGRARTLAATLGAEYMVVP
ncbi:MAG: VWA domain-containing protein [Dehalococcoidia bacterium]|nr:MAG: VWA domain-containing protein [Dehalococcoidia bacterium]